MKVDLMWRSRRGDIDPMFIKKPLYPVRHRSAYLMSTLFFLLVAFGYIAFHSSSLFLVPRLSLREPADGAFVRGGRVVLKGSTEPGISVSVNGYETVSGDDGIFELSLPVPAGYHLLDVRVKNRLGKEARIARRIVAE